jgi:hypothetical protein
MARPIKHGLDYLNLDTDIFQDRKIRKLIKEFGAVGFSVFIYLLCKIYDDEGYYIQLDEDLIFDISDCFTTNESNVQDIIQYSLQIDIFNEAKYDQYKILTSSGIYKRYSFAKSRSNFQIDKRYIVSLNQEISEVKNQDNDTELPDNVTETLFNEVKNAENKSISADNKHIGQVNESITGIIDSKTLNNSATTPPKYSTVYKINSKETFDDFLKKFNLLTNKNCIKTKATEELFLDRINEGYSVDKILFAVENAMKDEYHIKTNFNHITPFSICTPEKLDKFMNYRAIMNKSGNSKTTLQTITYESLEIAEEEWELETITSTLNSNIKNNGGYDMVFEKYGFEAIIKIGNNKYLAKRKK